MVRTPKEQSYEESIHEVKMAFEPIKDEIYKKVAPIANWLVSVLMYCTLYIDKKKIDRKRGTYGNVVPTMIVLPTMEIANELSVERMRGVIDND
ncbi:hypothetical protein [Paenibacillus crassostreae]|uniref:Uncharacterized protein n=1 Tax=Paenibacillus crassostreae TaxID=1763538 RepID=A0A167C4W7_9BACL|nr:hypothetical protein [Paenibacillus crassostreae]AOZ91641.1 hypothetical protein LPB68_05015 [Paenibacillus crassostreae]OAB72785.1 hypothetical protein PNBC_15235 [Paenibacillus crassostreae]